jgi:hypothetical protein
MYLIEVMYLVEVMYLLDKKQFTLPLARHCNSDVIDTVAIQSFWERKVLVRVQCEWTA